MNKITNNIKSTIRLDCNEELEIKYFAKDESITNTTMDCSELLEYINEIEDKNEELNNIINTILDFNFFKEECPLNFGYQEECNEEKAQNVFYKDDYCEKNCNDEYKKCWLKYFARLQELKGSDKE